MELLTMEAPLWLTLILGVVGYIMGAIIQYGIDKNKEE
jgi:hypothetical protein